MAGCCCGVVGATRLIAIVGILASAAGTHASNIVVTKGILEELHLLNICFLCKCEHNIYPKEMGNQ